MAQFENIDFPGWEVVRKIGEGSFGGVYEIHRTLPGGRVEKCALKKLSVPKDASEIQDLYSQSFSRESITAHYQDQMSELVREYSLTQELNGCKNVVACHDVKYVQHDDGIGWDIYIRMELLRPLKQVLGPEYRERVVLRLGMEMCNALLACQEHKIIHRDIKPENILVSEKGEFKLGDFGIAKVSERTATGTMTGSMGYMAPEVANRWHYGAQADIYSLGMVLYWMMNQRTLPFLPYPPAIPTALRRQEAANRRFAGEAFPPPVNGSRELKRIVMKACAFSTEKRYQSVQELRRELYLCYQQHTGRAPEPAVMMPAAAPTPDEPSQRSTVGAFGSIRGDKDAQVNNTSRSGRFAALPEEKKQPRKKSFKWIAFFALLLCGSVLAATLAVEASRASKYRAAQELMSAGEYLAAAQAFEALGNYSDSVSKAQGAYWKQEMEEKEQAYQSAQQLLDKEDYSGAAEAFEALGNYNDSVLRAQEASWKQEMEEKKQAYQSAQQLLDAEDYPDAAEAFEALGDYSDSASKAQEARQLQETMETMEKDYQSAQALMDEGKYMQAMWAFGALDYQDSQEKAQWAKDNYINQGGPTLSAGGFHTVGLCTDGTVVTTGSNDNGQCDVDSWTDIVAVAAGDFHTAGLRSDGTVVATGDNDYGQCDIDSWTDIVAVTAGDCYTVGLHRNGTVVATGKNDDGQCDVDTWTDIVAVAVGWSHTVGLRSDGTVVATGLNDGGQCDINSWADIVSIAAATTHTVGLRSNGTVVTAGWDQFDVANWTSIVAVVARYYHTVGLRSDGTVIATGWNDDGECDVDSWTDIVAVTAGTWHTVGLRSDGTVVATGSNNDGQCDVSGWKDIRLPQK